MNPNVTPPATPGRSAGRRGSARARQHEARNALRQANRRFLIVLALVALTPLFFPAVPTGALPAAEAEPKSARSAENPPYDNMPAEPAEGASSLRLTTIR